MFGNRGLTPNIIEPGESWQSNHKIISLLSLPVYPVQSWRVQPMRQKGIVSCYGLLENLAAPVVSVWANSCNASIYA